MCNCFDAQYIMVKRLTFTITRCVPKAPGAISMAVEARKRRITAPVASIITHLARQTTTAEHKLSVWYGRRAEIRLSGRSCGNGRRK